MLHHHGGAGYPYNAPTTGAVPFSPPPPLTSIGPVSVTSIPRPPMQLQPVGTSAFAELPADGPGGSAAGNFQDDDVPADVSTSRVGASSSGGNRWPREETLALIRIRSEMDADFRNAPFKAPLWEDVTRKLAGLGYQRSAKKCKEKFENVDKYYKRTKDARAGRQDGKSYRFFSQLEALHAAAPPPPQQQTAAMSTAQADRHPLATMAWTTPPAPPGASLPDPSFSSMSGSGSESDDEFDHDEEEGLDDGGGCDKKMVALFEGMMRQVTAKQDAMQRAFLETLERWEAERTAREEAWRLQEVARMNREQEQLSRERAAAASRDAALIAFLQRVGDGLPPPASAAAGPAPAPMPGRALPLPHHRDAAATTSLQAAPVPPPKAEEASWAWAGGGESGGSSTSSRWPKEEVQALIQLRTEKDEQDHDAGSKGPLWEDIAAGMRRIGYNRSAKRCKEKWENINKYFKKVKECNKRRPEDSKTCPYFHQLDAMYRKKRFAGRGGTAGSGTAPGAGSGQENLNQRELDGKSINDAGKRNTDGESSVHAPAGKVETAPTTTALANGAKSKKADDIVRETNVQLLQQEFTADETDSDGMGGNYADEGNDEDKMQYKMGFQKPSVIGSSGNAAATSPAARTSSTFLDVQ